MAKSKLVADGVVEEREPRHTSVAMRKALRLKAVEAKSTRPISVISFCSTILSVYNVVFSQRRPSWFSAQTSVQQCTVVAVKSDQQCTVHLSTVQIALQENLHSQRPIYSGL
jgi:hypothetical protein